MVKVKNRKRISVDDIQKRRKVQNDKKKVLNPFEVHINKEKMKVLGKKSNNQRGLPGVSRAKAIQKRKHTLLSEYKLQHKSNKFIDKRIGEKSKMSSDEKVAARFAAFKAKAHSKQSIFNLSGDVLSHKKHTLSEIEKFEDLSSEDEENDDDNKTGKLDSDFIEEAHFGNGVLMDTGVEGVKAHRKLIEQLIEESKKRKIEQQRIREATLELTEKLDDEWKDLVQLVSKKRKGDDNKDQDKPKVDDYDKYMRELKFEAKGTVSDRLKTENEIAKEEKEKLEKLEQERIDRMKGVTENNIAKMNHRSADDLDDDFVYESDTEENVLSYDTAGQSNVQVQAELNGKLVGADQDGLEESPNEEGSDNEEDDEKNSSNEEEDSDSEDSLADLKEGEESDVESEISPCKPQHEKIESTVVSENIKDVQPNKNKRKSVETSELSKTKKQKIDSVAENDNILPSEKEELDKAGNELPFTFKIPDSYENLMQTFKNKSTNHQEIILERMIKCNHPSLAQGNKDNLGILFDYLLQYLNDLFTDIEDAKSVNDSFKLFKALMPHIYSLAQLNPENTHKSVLEVIKEKQQEYRKKKKKYPGIEVLIFLKLVSLLFSTSDFRHQIVTPCFVFMEQMLKTCTVKTPTDISYGLFLCTLILEYTSLSNRYLPVAINFLSGILHMSIPKTSVKLIKVVPPFKPLSSELVLIKQCLKLTTNDKLNVSALLTADFTNQFKISVLNMVLRLLKDFNDIFKNYPSNIEIFDTIQTYISQIPFELYPEKVRKEHQEFCDSLDKLKSERKLQYLILEEKRPKALRLYEPKIEKVYDGKRRKVQSREKADRDKLLQKLKRETKGALREIRRDKSFLARVKVNQRIQSDKERREKVNKIFAEAAIQQNELNSLDRKKKKK